jgi:thymidylate kinase
MLSRGFTVALIGPDGAGKTTVARAIQDEFQGSVKYLYMGVNPEASNRRLPTTKLVHLIRRIRAARRSHESLNSFTHTTAKPTSVSVRSALRAVRLTLALVNRLAEEWYRYGIAWSSVLRGSIVLFDRHFYADYYASDVSTAAPRPVQRRIHGFMLYHFYPRPDLLVYLDAPAEVLFDRKGEGTVESLDRRRQDYLEVMRTTNNATVVDANRPLDQVTRDVSEIIRSFSAARASRKPS